MTEDNKKLSTSSDQTTSMTTTPNNKLAQGKKLTLPGLHQRLRQPSLMQQFDPNTMPNRLALMLDVSGSMSGDKIESLRNAVASFLNSCNFQDTSVALETFGAGPGAHRVALTTQQPLLLMTTMGLEASGSTPMDTAMDYVLNSYSITRGVLVSDGQPDSEHAVYESAEQYKTAGLPVDCVHIGDSSHGEACLRRVAELTGGQYIKFTDIASFAKNFKYLTPAYYAMLTSGNISAEDLGAKEIK